MIRITVAREGDTHTLTITGHAGAAPKGQDIVCAWVSAVYQTALLGLEAVANKHPEFVTIDKM